MSPQLSDQEINDALKDLPGWTTRDGKLHRVFEFSDFSEAFAFMTRVALVAEKMNHHPDWTNVWNKITVDLVTHSAGGVTASDVELAAQMNKFAG